MGNGAQYHCLPLYSSSISDFKSLEFRNSQFACATAQSDPEPEGLPIAVITKAQTSTIEIHAAAADLQQTDRTKRNIQRIWNAIKAGIFYSMGHTARPALSLKNAEVGQAGGQHRAGLALR